ncbi:hypothetical protein TNCV_3109981 [Trichonephila clavipes]|nr:hypothetical protein TNCV_3109981 [Trichonephila clavipes]
MEDVELGQNLTETGIHLALYKDLEGVSEDGACSAGMEVVCWCSSRKMGGGCGGKSIQQHFSLPSNLQNMKCKVFSGRKSILEAFGLGPQMNHSS